LALARKKCQSPSQCCSKRNGLLRFPLPIHIPSASPQSSSLSPEAGTIGQEWPQCQ
jgi:hypothetical protein